MVQTEKYPRLELLQHINLQLFHSQNITLISLLVVMKSLPNAGHRNCDQVLDVHIIYFIPD